MMKEESSMKQWWKRIVAVLAVACVFLGTSRNVMAEGTQIPAEIVEKYIGGADKYYDVGGSVGNGIFEIKSTSDSLKAGDTVEVQIIYNAVGNESGEGTGSAGTGTDSSNENTGSSGSSTNVPTSSTNNTNANETAVAAPAVSSTDNITAVNAINTATIADTAMKDNHANAESIINTASTETTSTAANHPKTFQTGVEDFGTNLLLLGAVFGLAGIEQRAREISSPLPTIIL